MILFKKQDSTNVCDYAPIAKALLLPLMDESTRARLKRKFEIAYLIAKEKMPFKKMKSLCDLEERHGVDVGGSYRNDHACATFIEYIATDLRKQLREAINKAKFFSIQIDSRTDYGNVDEELFIVLYFDGLLTNGKVVIRDKFFAVQHLRRGTGQGLFLKSYGLFSPPAEWKQKIGLGCDSTSANLGSGGLRGHFERDVPWIIVYWCLAHRLELSIKDVLKATFFATVNYCKCTTYTKSHLRIVLN